MWHLGCSAVPGFGHDRNDEKSCQDVVLKTVKKDFACICLADGAGSALYAREGASIIVKCVSSLLERHFFMIYNRSRNKVANYICDNIVSAIGKECELHQDGREIKDYNATLLAVAAKGNKIVVIHVGDGIVGSLTDGVLSVVSFPWNGEFKNETIFATSSQARSEMDIQRFGQKGKEISFFIMSDGTSASFYSEKNRDLISKAGLKQICAVSKQLDGDELDNFIHYNLFEQISKNTADDCSLCIMTKT